jgi:hypothetical protein
MRFLGTSFAQRSKPPCPLTARVERQPPERGVRLQSSCNGVPAIVTNFTATVMITARKTARMANVSHGMTVIPPGEFLRVSRDSAQSRSANSRKIGHQAL